MNNIVDLAQVVIKLPVPFFGLKIPRKIGFKFGTLAYANMCNLYSPAIDFHQIDEAMKEGKDEAFIKLIVGGAMAYSFNKKCIVTEKLVRYWFASLKAKKRDELVDKINISLSECTVTGTPMSKILEKARANKQVKKK